MRGASVHVMKTFRLNPAAGDRAAAVAGEIDKLLSEGKRVAVTMAEEQELLRSSRQLVGSGSHAST